MTDNPLLTAALAYAARGWYIFPCKPREKKPFDGTHGCKDGTTDEAIIRAWWKRWPAANVALACGKKSGIYVVDVDIKKEVGVDGWEALKEFPDMPETVQQVTPRGGAHFLYRTDDPPRNKNSFRPGIDIRADGYYVMLAPSIHPNGKVYEWGVSPDEVPLAEFPAFMRPPPPPKSIPPWERKPEAPRKASASPQGTPVVERARLYLRECEPATQGQAGHDKLLWAARALVVGFELDEGTALSLLWDDFNPRCNPQWDRSSAADAKDFERKVREVAKTPGAKPRGWLLDECGLRGVDAAREAYGNALAEALLASMKQSEPSPAPEPEVEFAIPKKTDLQGWPARLMNPPGFVGDLAAWINATAGKKQPALAVLAAFVGAGIMMGRKVRDVSNGRTNIYAMAVADTSSGKDHPGKCLAELFAAAVAEAMLGGGRVTSDSAIEFALMTNPVQLFTFDEAGDMYSSIRSAGGGGSGFLKTILPCLKELWSSANGLYRGKQRADEEIRRIDQPHVGIWSGTTPKRLYEGLTSGDLEDGWLARVVTVISRNNPEYEFVEAKPPPAHLVDIVHRWHVREITAPDGAGDVMGSVKAWQIMVRDSDGARAAYKEFGREAHALTERSSVDPTCNLWGKALENARRFALTLAAGCDFDTPVIEREHAEFAIDFVRQAIKDFTVSIRDGMADNPWAAEKIKLLSMIASHGRRGASKSEITRASQFIRDKRTRNSYIEDLVEAGLVVHGMHPEHPEAKMGWLWKAPWGLDVVVEASEAKQ